MKSRKKKRLDASDLEAAQLIVTDVDKYGGDQALCVMWARAINPNEHASWMGKRSAAARMLKMTPEQRSAANPLMI